MRKYLVYKLTGGLNHTLHQLNKTIYLANITNRILIFDGYNGMYGDLEFPFFNIPDFKHYFNVPTFSRFHTDYGCLYDDNTIDNELFESYKNSKFKPCGKFLYESNGRLVSPTEKEIINSKERIVFCGWVRHETNLLDNIKWRIKVNQNIVNKFEKKRIYDQYIGMHFRNTDRKNDLNPFIPKLLDHVNNINKIYLATDDYIAYKRLYDLIGNKFEIIQYNKPIKVNDNEEMNLKIYGKTRIGIHHVLKGTSIMDTLADMYHLRHSTYFIHSDTKHSTLSQLVTKFRNHDNFFQ